jgi:hypothetical protein
MSGAYMVSAHFGKQHINLVNPIIDYTSFFITGALTNARKRRFDLYLMITEDEPFQCNGLRANAFLTLDAVPSCRIKIQGLKMVVELNNSRKAFWLNMNQNISEMSTWAHVANQLACESVSHLAMKSWYGLPHWATST